MLAQDIYPNLDISEYLSKLDGIAVAIKKRLPGDAFSEQRVLALNYYLFNEMRFSGNLIDYYDPRNSYLNEVMERRTGIPITLSILYLEVGKRLGLNLKGVSFPGHFLVKLAVKRGQLVLDPRIRPAPAPRASSALREGGAGAARPVSGAGDPAPDHREGPAQSEEHLYADGKARTGARGHAQDAARDAGVGRGTSRSWAGVPPARVLPAGAVGPAELSAAAAAGAGRSGNPRKDPGAQAGKHAPQLTGQSSFDFCEKVAFQAERKERLGHEKDRRDEYLEQIVRERGPAAFEHVAHELEECTEPHPPRCSAGPARYFRCKKERTDRDRRGESERHIQEKVVRENRAEENVREGHAFAQGYPVHRDQDREDDRGHTDEVGEPVPAIAMVGGVDRHLFVESFHAAPGSAMSTS